MAKGMATTDSGSSGSGLDWPTKGSSKRSAARKERMTRIAYDTAPAIA
jgi:hypothetical protein